MIRPTPIHLYDMADNSGIPLELRGAKIRGAVSHVLDFHGLKVRMEVKIVSSFQGDDTATILCTGPGNLALLFVNGRTLGKGNCVVLDLSKLDLTPVDLFETQKVKSQNDIRDLLRPAVVAAFKQTEQRTWGELKIGLNHLDGGREGTD